MKPVEQIASWLFTVARNKITDRYRKKKPVFLEDVFVYSGDGEEDGYLLDDLLPAANVYSAETEMMRTTVMEILTEALAELPAEQRDVFIWHELEDKSFKEIADLTNAPLNTLLSRKRYAVLYLREKLKDVYAEMLEKE
jgi:RNA polymerase sigma factor (sigma-70 family)